MPGSASKRSSNEPAEWRDGQAKARQTRITVSEQLAELIVDRDMTGGRDLFARRLTELAEAEREGDAETRRAAVMEISHAAAAWVVAMDLRQRSSERTAGPVRS